MSTTAPSPQQMQDNLLAQLGKHWGVALVLGIVSLIIGIVALVWPAATIVVIAILLAIWLLVSGVFEIVRAFGHGLSGGMRALLLITGVLSIFVGILAFRSAFEAVEILSIFIGIAFLFRGFGALFTGIESKDGRGWNIFGGIIMLIGGIVVLTWPGMSLVTLAWVCGIWLIVIGIFEIIAAFRIRSMHNKLASA